MRLGRSICRNHSSSYKTLIESTSGARTPRSREVDVPYSFTPARSGRKVWSSDIQVVASTVPSRRLYGVGPAPPASGCTAASQHEERVDDAPIGRLLQRKASSGSTEGACRHRRPRSTLARSAICFIETPARNATTFMHDVAFREEEGADLLNGGRWRREIVVIGWKQGQVGSENSPRDVIALREKRGNQT